jgi:flagellar hook assembly protein FlgD
VEEEIGIYRFDNNGWKYIGGTVDKSKQTISAKVQKIGTFQVQTGPHVLFPENPTVFGIAQNMPNPMNSQTLIQYQLPQQCHVHLTIYDITGRAVRKLIDRTEEPGYKSICWDGRNNEGRPLASGVYFYRIQAKDFSCTKQLIMVK